MARQTIDILKQPIPTLLVTFAALLGLFSFRSVSSPRTAEIAAAAHSPLGELMDSLAAAAPAAAIAISIFLTVICAVLLTSIVSRYSVSVVRSFIPLVIYAIGVCGVLFAVRSISIQAAMLLLVLSGYRMIVSFKRTERFDDVMCAAFHMGLAVLIYPQLTICALTLPLLFAIYKRSWRELAAGVLMFCLPIVPVSFGWWIAGSDPLYIATEYFNGLSQFGTINPAAVYEACGGLFPAILFGLTNVLTVVSIAVFVMNFDSMRLRAHKIHTQFILLYVAGWAMLLWGNATTLSVSVMAMASVPLIHTFFVKCPGIGSTVVYIGLVAASIAAVIA